MFIIIDTNILLHCKPLDELNWIDHFGTGAVDVVLCSTVLEELDDKKNDPSTSDRAKAADRMLRRYEEADDQIAPGVTLRFVESDSVSESQNDSKIIRCAQRLSESENNSVVILTNDSLMRRRARTYSIKVVAPTPEWMKPSIDQSARKIQQLEKQLSKLQNRTPKLKILVTTGPISNPTSKITQPRAQFSEIDIDGAITEIKAENPKIDPDFSDFDAYRVRRFNRDLESYFVQMERFLQFANSVNSILERTIVMQIWLCNKDGSVPANNVRGEVKFDDSVLHVTTPTLWNRWKDGHSDKETKDLVELFGDGMEPPEKPARPREIEIPNFLSSGMIYPPLHTLNRQIDFHTSLNASGRKIEVWAKSVDHCDQLKIGSAMVIFEESYPSQPVQWPTSVISDELPDHCRGKILLKA